MLLELHIKMKKKIKEMQLTDSSLNLSSKPKVHLDTEN